MKASMSFEAWRLSFQSDEQAARAAYAEVMRLHALLHHQGASHQQPAESKPCA